MTSLPEYLIEFKSKVEHRLGTLIDFVEDRETQFPAKIEYARNYAREHHVVRYNPNKCKNAYPLFAILLQSYILFQVEENGKIGVLQPASSLEEEQRFDADFKADSVGRATLRRMGAEADAIEKNLLGGIITQASNQILEMLAADIVLRDYPEAVADMKVYLKDAALEGAAIPHEKLREVYPKFLVDTNRILNLMFSMKCGEVCGEKIIEAYKPTSDEIDLALDLYNFYRKERDSLKDKGTIAADVLKSVLREVKVDRYAHLIVREIAPEDVSAANVQDDGLTDEQRKAHETFFENFGDGKKDSELMVLGMFKVLREVKKMPLEAVKSLALEIAMLGTRGISPTSKYTLKGLPNRGEIWGSEVLAYYYVTWAKVFPDKLDLIGLPYKQAYASAVAMLDRMNGDNSTKTPMGGGVIHRIIYPMAA